MSFYSYIEVVEKEPRDRKDNSDEELYIRFRRGISWEYQLALSGGSYLYQASGVTNNPYLEQLADSFAKLIFEQQIDYSLRNYHEAVKACKALLKLNIPELNESIQEDLDRLQEANKWFIGAYNKMPAGLVRLDWGELAWGLDEASLYTTSKLPDQHMQFFREMSIDTSRFINKQLTESFLTKKYKQNNEFTI